MPRSNTSLPRRLLPFLLIGTIGVIYSLIKMRWDHLDTFFALVPLLFIIELFPVRVGKVLLSFTFPVLYVMVLITGFEATALTSVGVLSVIAMAKRRPWRLILINGYSRIVSLLAADVVIHLINFILPMDKDFSYFLLHLIVTLAVFTFVSIWLVMGYLSTYSNSTEYRMTVYKLTSWHVLISFLYCVLMLTLAFDQRHAASGALGTFFFFLPLTAGMIVVHLITNLTRAKSGLETLFAVARSMNRQFDLPTVLEHMVREAKQLVQAHSAQFYLVLEDGTLQRMGCMMEGQTVKRLPRGSGLVGAVALSGESLIVPDVLRDPRFCPAEADEETLTLLLVPIEIDGRVAGVISLGKRETHLFYPDDLKMMSIFATHAAVAMQNALYLEERERRLLVEERNRLAREMHDGIAQELASAILQVEMIKRLEPAQSKEGLNRLEDGLRKTATALRESIYSLRPQPYTHVGLVPALRSQLDEVEEEYGLATHLSVDLQNRNFSPEVTRAVFQIFTEAVQNVIKHAEARDLWVNLASDERALILTVRDNGRGFHFGEAIVRAAERHSFGIENLHHIAEDINGTLDYLTAPGRGTEVQLEIPLKEEGPHDHSSFAV